MLLCGARLPLRVCLLLFFLVCAAVVVLQVGAGDASALKPPRSFHDRFPESLQVMTGFQSLEYPGS